MYGVSLPTKSFSAYKLACSNVANPMTHSTHIPRSDRYLTLHILGYWEKLVPKRHIIQGLRQDVLEWVIARQKMAVEKYGIEGKHAAPFAPRRHKNHKNRLRIPRTCCDCSRDTAPKQ